MPHDLVAIARDRDGRELDRAARWINLGARRTGTTLAVRSDSTGRARALSVDWESIGQTQPAEIEVVFDGQPLEVADPDDIPLPPHEGNKFHYASANVRFPGHDDNPRDTDVGSLRAAEISSELTAVVVGLEKGSRLPAMARMHSWFQKKDASIAIHGVEKGEMDLYVVRGPGAHDALDRLAQAVVHAGFRAGSHLASRVIDWHPQRFFAGEQEDAEERIRASFWQLRALREHGPLSPKIRLSFISPRPGPLTPAGLGTEIFARSRTYSASEGGLSWLFQRQPKMSFAPRTSAAVALAGMTAHAGSRRRAVLLITADAAEDASEYSAAMTRQYLRALQVPLYVGSLATETPDLPWAEGAFDLGDPAKPLAAARRLARASVCSVTSRTSE